MKLHLAGYTTGKKTFNLLEEKTLGKVHFLETYLAVKKTGLKEDFELYGKPFFLDSGAFSAATLGVEIGIPEYVEFIKRNLPYLSVYANLDVIGNPDETLNNQKKMEALGLKPLPTFHLGSDPKYFVKYVHEYDYIGLGGMVPYARKPQKIKAFLDYCFSYVTKNKLKTKFHGWGMTNPTFMKRYPFYSIDSTGWLAGGKFNRLYKYKDGVLSGFSAADYRKKFNIDFGKIDYVQKNNHNISELYKYIDYITSLHKAMKIDYFNQ